MIDIEPSDLETVKAILSRYIPEYEVWIFGSRVNGTAKKFSDLDLAVITDSPLNLDTLIDLKAAFSDSDLPFKVDIVDWATTSENFKNIINKQHIEL